jgi:hypothetical protein
VRLGPFLQHPPRLAHGLDEGRDRAWLHLDDAGAVQHRLTFDAFGTPTVGSPAPFGFAGELHVGGLQYLRARWYAGQSIPEAGCPSTTLTFAILWASHCHPRHSVVQ